MNKIRLQNGFAPYSEYKDSGIEWIGKIPKEWRTERLKYFGSFVGGGTPKMDVIEYWNGNIPWVSSKDMKEGVIRDTEDHITEIGLKESSSRLVKEKSLLIVYRSGILQRKIPTAINLRPVAINQDIRGFLPGPHIASKFIHYIFSGNQNSLLALLRKEGATVESLEHKYVENLEIPILSVSEQEKIVRYLDEKTKLIDAIIERKNRLIELLREKRAAVINQAVTKGLDPNVELVDSGIEWIGKIPNGWSVERLKYIAPQRNTKVVSGNKNHQKYIGLENIESGTGRFIKFEIEAQPESVVNSFQKGDVLFGKLRPYLAKVFAPQFDGISTSELLDLVPEKNKVIQQYLAYKIISRDFIKLVDDSTYGTRMPRASWGFIGNQSIVFPSVEEQSLIVSELEKKAELFDQIIKKLESSIMTLKEFKSSLISNVVTGKVRV